ncbi:MAG: hypothetical protein V3U71_04590 [Cocleimonas sp.]
MSKKEELPPINKKTESADESLKSAKGCANGILFLIFGLIAEY